MKLSWSSPVISKKILSSLAEIKIFNTYSMKPDLYCFETIKMTSQAYSILYGEYELQASIQQLWTFTGLVTSIFMLQIVQIRLFHSISVL